MDTMKHKEIARDFFARYDRGDIAGALDLMSDEATWWLAGKPDLNPAAGLYTKEEIAVIFRRMDDRLENGLRMSVKSAIAEDDGVALEVESHGDLKNGHQYRNEYHTLMRISDGKISEVREYMDTQHVYEVWLRPRSNAQSSTS